MKTKKLLTMLLATVMLAGCTVERNSTKSTGSNSTTSTSSQISTGDNTSSDTSTGDKTSSDTSTGDKTSTNSTSNITPVETYVIRINASNGVTVTPNVTRAEKGETVTLTVTVSEGYTLESLTVDNKTLQGTENNNGEIIFTFVMPDKSVTVKTSVSVSGEVTLTGDVAAVLTLQEDGVTYAAYDVEVNTNSYIAFTVGGNPLSVTQIDRTKCLADIGLGPSNVKNGFSLAGGAKYNFFYNPELGDECCYIQRSEVTRLPSDSDSLWSLFAGSVKSDPSTYPQGLVGVRFSSTESNTSYEWNLYDDNSSFATVKRLGMNTVVANVHKKLEGNTYSVVDTYIESTYDQTRGEDTRAFSAKYEIVDETISEFRDRQMTEHDALFDIMNPSHDTTSIDFDIMYGYRTGFNTNYDNSLKATTLDIVSTKNPDDTFTVNVNSSKTYEASETALNQTHITYKINLTFTKSGALLNGDYIEKHYSNSEYDFSKLEFFPGGELGGQEKMALSFEYIYGNPMKNNVDFDDSIYFAKSVTATVHNKDLYPNATNTLNQTNEVDKYIDIDAEPNTALDVWQYRVISSSDENVISKKDGYQRKFYANKKGVSTLTIGNDTTNDVTAKVDVTVEQTVSVRSFYMQGCKDGRPVYDDYVYAAHAELLAGTVKEVYVSPSPSNAPVEFTAVSENEDLVKVTVNGQIMTLDLTGAGNITTQTSVRITIHSDYYVDEEWCSPTVFEIHITPNAVPSSGPLGTWVNLSEKASVTFTDVDSSYANNFKKAYITTSTESNVEFAYSFDKTTGIVTVSGANIDGNTFVGYFRFTGTGTIEGCLAYSTYMQDSENGGGAEYLSDIIGYYFIDEEGWFVESQSTFVELTRQDA